MSYLPPVVVGLVDEQEDLVLSHEDLLAVLRDVLEVEGHVDVDLAAAGRRVGAGMVVVEQVMVMVVSAGERVAAGQRGS